MKLLKGLLEKRNAKIEEMQGLVALLETETRGFTQEEMDKFNAVKEEVRALDETIKAAEDAEKMEKRDLVKDTDNKVEDMETRAFESYLRGHETRAGEQNVNMGNNGAIIPTTIASKIIDTVRDRSPILAKAEMYAVKGTLKIPVWGLANTTHDITTGYQTEFTELVADAGKFSSIDLSGYLAGSLVLIGKSVVNNAQVDIVSFVVNKVADKIATFIEGELLKGTGSSAAQGVLVGATNTKTLASKTAITSDELIDIQSQVKQSYQQGACWIMSPTTFALVRKLKYTTGEYLLQPDYTSDFPYRLLGKPVYVSDNMPEFGSTTKPIVYGDFTGLSVNFREGIEIQLLMEKYATQHAIGVCAWFEFDSKVTDNQKIAVAVCPA